MRLINYSILFIILASTLWLVTDVKANDLIAVTQKKIEYNKMIDSAVDDGVSNLVELDSRRDVLINKEEAIKQFYTSLYANFGVIGHSVKEKQLRAYIPTVIIIDTDGYYVYYSDSYQENGVNIVTERWTDKLTYAFEDNDLIYKFTLGKFVTIYDKKTKEIHQGEYRDLAAMYPSTILANELEYHETRRNTIVTEIEDTMGFYINKHNKIARQFGISYNFTLPNIEKTDWYRTIDDISMLVVFQGYPYGTFGTDTYNRYAFGGAKISKIHAYYTQMNFLEGKLYYHKYNCEQLTIKNMPFYTKEACAIEGAMPCPTCKP